MTVKPYAITLDAGSSLANKTGSWRTERPVYVDRLPPCNDACPAGENVQAWLYEAEEGEAGYERAWRKLMEDNPLPAVMGRVCYHPCETACNRGRLDEAVGIHAVGALPRRRGDRARLAGPGRGRAERQAGAGGRRRAIGTLGRLPPRQARARGDDPRRRAGGRRHDALRDPAVPAAAGRPRRRGEPHPRPRRLPGAGQQGRQRARRDARGRLRRRLPRRGRPPRPPRRRPGRRGRADRRRRLAAGEHGGGRAPQPRPPRRGLRRRRHGDGRGADGASGSARATRWSSIAAPATGCRLTTSRSRRRRRRA